MAMGESPEQTRQTERREVEAYVGLGANLGDAAATLRAAVESISSLPGTRLRAVSRYYRSAPVDAQGPDYVNAVVALHTCLAAEELLARLQAIENTAGRLRPFSNAPRTLDLDLLLYGDEVIQTSHLTVPHPRMRGRAFVLLPLADVAPERVAASELRGVSGQRIAPIEAG